ALCPETPMRTSLFLLVLLGLASWGSPALARPPQAVEDPRRLQEHMVGEQKQALLAASASRLQAAVQEAACHGFPDELAKLLARGAEEDLFVAAALGKADRVTVLLQADPTLQDVAGWGGNTALHFASANGQTAVAKQLLAHGANIEAKNQDETTA